MESQIPPGATLLTYNQVRQRLGGESETTFHDRKKRDATFPRPIYLSPREPRIFAHELDAWMQQQAAKRGQVAQEREHATT